jgi:SAM-dependent methyltransferase
VSGATACSNAVDPSPATLARSVALFRAFRREQTDPQTFYRVLAEDSVGQLSAFCDLAGRIVVDIGGGPGHFAAAFRVAGAKYFRVDPDVGELAAAGPPGPDTVIASGLKLPFRTGSVDVAYSSNVLEHVAEPEVMATEMARVLRPGGTAFLSFTLWLSPWGGHETSPWHYLGGARARRRYIARNGREPKNRFGETLFPLSAARMISWAARQPDVRVVRAFPRYHPQWLHWVTRVPGVREMATWNLALVLRKS